MKNEELRIENEERGLLSFGSSGRNASFFHNSQFFILHSSFKKTASVSLRGLLLPILCLFAMKSLAQGPPRGRGLVLAGEAVRFSDDRGPEFTAAQLGNTVASTRAGLAAWAKTSEGREWVEKLGSGEYEVVVTEDGDDQSLGEAPQPGIATLVAAADRKKVKRFTINLNPYVAADYTSDRVRYAEIPSPDIAMAAAWAGEMLHVSFYAAGIPLPHHERPEFQRRWYDVARELGVGKLKHLDASDRANR
jgi:hypothetical protein